MSTLSDLSQALPHENILNYRRKSKTDSRGPEVEFFSLVAAYQLIPQDTNLICVVAQNCSILTSESLSYDSHQEPNGSLMA